MAISIKDIPKELLNIILDYSCKNKIEFVYINFGKIVSQSYFYAEINIIFNDVIIPTIFQHCYQDDQFDEALQCLTKNDKYGYLENITYNNIRQSIFERLSNGNYLFLNNKFPSHFKQLLAKFICDMKKLCLLRKLQKEDIEAYKKYNIDITNFHNFEKMVIPNCFKIVENINSYKPYFGNLENIKPCRIDNTILSFKYRIADVIYSYNDYIGYFYRGFFSQNIYFNCISYKIIIKDTIYN